MRICEAIVAIVSTILGNESHAAQLVLIVFVCIYIFFFASTWGPGGWCVCGEIFPLQVRAKGIALSTASNWLWNFVIAFVTPYLVDPDKANIGVKVFFIWTGTCFGCVLFTYFFVYETKQLSLEQVDNMMKKTTARKSSTWTPTPVASEVKKEKARKSSDVCSNRVTQEQLEDSEAPRPALV